MAFIYSRKRHGRINKFKQQIAIIGTHHSHYTPQQYDRFDESERGPFSPSYGDFSGSQFGRRPGDKSPIGKPDSQVGILVVSCLRGGGPF